MGCLPKSNSIAASFFLCGGLHIIPANPQIALGPFTHIILGKTAAQDLPIPRGRCFEAYFLRQFASPK
jgi:hypothetical protein